MVYNIKCMIKRIVKIAPISLLICILFACVEASIPTFMAYINEVNSDLIMKNNMDELVKNSAIFAGIALVIMSISAIKNFLAEYIKDKAGNAYKEELHEKINNAAIKDLQGYEDGDFLSRVKKDSFEVVNSVANLINNNVVNILTLVVAIIFMLKKNKAITIVAFLIPPILILIGFYFNKRIVGLSNRKQRYLGELESLLSECIQGKDEICNYELENVYVNKVLKKRKDLNGVDRKISYLHNISLLITSLSSTFLTVISTYYIGHLAIAGKLTVGDALAFSVLIPMIQEPMTKILTTIMDVQKQTGAFERLNEISGLKDNTKDCDKYEETPEYAVEFKNVDFSYEDKKLFSGMNLKIKNGEKVAIIGKSGSGKSTLLNLITGLYDAQTGYVKVMGRKVEGHAVSPSYIGLIPQIPYFFKDTLSNNIFFDGDRNEALFDELCVELSLDDYVGMSSIEKDFNINDESQLSVGQRKRFSFIRMLRRDLPIYVLDEPTSGVDKLNSDRIMDFIYEYLEEKTVIIISHDLEQVKNMDRIIVMEQGKIVEQGNHDELIRNNGIYTGMTEINK